MVPTENQTPTKVKGAWHDPVYTKVTLTSKIRRAKNKLERQYKRLGRTK